MDERCSDTGHRFLQSHPKDRLIWTPFTKSKGYRRPNLRCSPTGALFGIPIEYLRLLNLQDIIDLQHSQTDELKAEEFAATNGHTQFSVYCIGTRQQTVGMHKTMVEDVTLKSSVPQGQHPRSCSIAQFN